jgi:PAS domain S-box-containing protein
MRAKGTAVVAAVLGWLRRLTGGHPSGSRARASADATRAGGAGRPVAGGPGAPSLNPTRSPRERAATGGQDLERLWAQAALLSSHGVAIVDPSSATLRAVNAAYAQLVGRTPGQLEGQASNAIYPAAEQLQLLIAEHAADLNGAATLQTQQLHRDGTLIPVEVALVSVRAGSGPVGCRVQTVTDLRARLRAETELRFGDVQHSAAARFRQLADSAPVGILLMDADGGLSYANPCWLAITELPAEQARGDGWWDAVHPDDRERVSDAWEGLTRGAPLDIEFRYRRAGGEIRSVHSRAAALRDDGGALVGFMCVDVDVTEQLQQRAAIDGFHGRIRALANRLERLREDERAELARRLHGTLREELTTLKGEIESLRARGAAPAADSFGALAELAERCLQHLRHITFELQPPGVEELGLADAMQRFADECAAQSGLRVELTDAGAVPDLGRRRSLALYRTLQEALTNVVRHARASHVEAHVWVQDGAVHLRVSDDGVGIGDRDRGKAGCFGLLTASERLTQLGGALRVFGVPGRGTTLDASIPVGSGKEQRAGAMR